MGERSEKKEVRSQEFRSSGVQESESRRQEFRSSSKCLAFCD
jgi:hypothetical protein